MFLDLRCLYELLRQVNEGIKTMTDAMSKYLRQQGTKLVEEHCGGGGDNDANGGNQNPVQFIQVFTIFSQIHNLEFTGS